MVFAGFTLDLMKNNEIIIARGVSFVLRCIRSHFIRGVNAVYIVEIRVS
jgi:hypothetical protein